MPPRTTPFIPEHYYHIYNRGINRQPIFLGEDNWIYFITRMREYFQKEIAEIILEQFGSVKEYQKFVEEGRDGKIDKIAHLTLEG